MCFKQYFDVHFLAISYFLKNHVISSSIFVECLYISCWYAVYRFYMQSFFLKLQNNLQCTFPAYLLERVYYSPCLIIVWMPQINWRTLVCVLLLCIALVFHTCKFVGKPDFHFYLRAAEAHFLKRKTFSFFDILHHFLAEYFSCSSIIFMFK